MPTYRVKQIPERPLSRKLRYLVECEGCGAALGETHTPGELSGVVAGVVAGLWPQLGTALECHETACSGCFPSFLASRVRK